MNEFANRSRFHGPLRAVIFDWAGTTLDFGSLAPVRAVMEAFRRRDVPITVEEARGPMGMAKRDHLRALLNLPEISARWQSLHGRTPTENDVDELYRQFLPLQKELVVAHAALVSGCLEAVSACRERGLKIGSTTGYTRELMDLLMPLARAQGFEPDATVVSDDVEAGRPAPWMCFECARRLNVYPPDSIVVVDDTVVGIEAGLNSGMWTVGVVQSGNVMGLSEQEFAQLDPSARVARTNSARRPLAAAGAHFLIDTVADLPTLLLEINDRLGRGDHP